MKNLRPIMALLLGLFSTAIMAQGSCPKGYGMNWQGQCLDCSQTANAMVCAGGGESSSTPAVPSTDQKIQQATQILNAVDALSTYMDEHAGSTDSSEPETSDLQRQIEAQDRADAQRRQNDLQTIDSLDDSMAAMQDSDWRSRAQGDKPAKGSSDDKKTAAVDCNCRKAVGSCTATITLLKQQKTGVDYRVSSDEQQCSKVSYYIDNTPYITVLNNRSSTTEHSAGLTNISAKSFAVERCDVCAQQ